jgi:dynein heavy chain
MQDNPFALEDFYKENEKEISYLIDLVRGNLDSVRRKIIVALVTTDVHARDIIENLKNEKVESI